MTSSGWAGVEGRSESGCWPTPDQVLLLRAGVVDPLRAAEEWGSWREAHTLEAANHFELSLFPLVFRNLGASLPAADQAKLRGAYRSTWVRNQLFFAGAAEALELLRAAGIETMLLKGAAVAVASYGDTGVR